METDMKRIEGQIEAMSLALRVLFDRIERGQHLIKDVRDAADKLSPSLSDAGKEWLTRNLPEPENWLDQLTGRPK